VTDNVVRFPDGVAPGSTDTQGTSNITAAPQARIDHAWVNMRDILRVASKLHGRDRVAVAVGAVCQFLMQDQTVFNENLHAPLLEVHAALRDLDQNNVSAIFRPRKHTGRSVLSHDRAILIAYALGAVGRLEFTGMPRRAAEAEIASRLSKLGIAPLRGQARITAKTLYGWRARLEEVKPRLRERLRVLNTMSPAALHLLNTIRPEDQMWTNIAANVEGMLSEKWRLRLQRRPQQQARQFILDALENALCHAGFLDKRGD
jgi:hypothetical protein